MSNGQRVLRPLSGGSGICPYRSAATRALTTEGVLRHVRRAKPTARDEAWLQGSAATGRRLERAKVDEKGSCARGSLWGGGGRREEEG